MANPSDLILPRSPTNLSGINQAGAEFETLRFNILNRFIETPSVFSMALSISDYLSSSLVAATYEYQWVSKKWKKNAVLSDFSSQEIEILVLHPEQTSFQTDAAQILVKDMKYNMDTQQAIYDADTSNLAALHATAGYRSMMNRLKDYMKDFSNQATMDSEVMKLIQTLHALDE